MQVILSRINRMVDIDDKIAAEYISYQEDGLFSENPIILALMYDFNHLPSQNEMPDKELAQYCEAVILEEINMYKELPKLSHFLNDGGKEELTRQSDQNNCVEISI